MAWDPFKDGGAIADWDPFRDGGAIPEEEKKAEQAPFKAFAQSAVSGIGAAAKGLDVAAYALPPINEGEMSVRFDAPQAGEDYRRRTAQPKATQLKEIKAGPTYQWGQALQEAAAEIYPLSDAEREGLLTKGGEMAGGFLPLVASGPAAPATIGLQTVGDNLEADYQRQLSEGKTADEAAAHAIDRSLASGATQAALFEVLPAPLRKLGDQTVAKLGRSTLQKFLANRLAQAGEGAVLGGASRATDNAVMGEPIAEDVGTSAAGLAIMQAVMPRGGSVRRTEDTGRNVPETKATLDAQQQQLIDGRRPAQMFPRDAEGKVTNELPLPEGFERLETSRGIFHYDPQRITAPEIERASNAGRENDVLALGPASKADVAQRTAAGEPEIGVTERTPAGTEVKTAVSTPSLAEKTAAELERTKTPGNTVQAEPLQKTIAERKAPAGNFVDELTANGAQRVMDARARDLQEKQDRATRQQELADKRTRFDERLTVADQVLANPATPFPAVQGALESVRFYAEDNSLGLSQPQRVRASQAAAALTKRLEALKPAEDARAKAEQAKAAADAAAVEQQKAAGRTAAKQEFKAAETAGVSPTGALDYGRLPEKRLTELAQGGDKRAERELFTRAERPAEDRESLIDALGKVKLPTSDPKLGGELQLLIREEMNPQQRKKFVAAQAQPLDYVAQALRERGFREIKTPADVIDHVQRALRGEDIRAEPAEEVPFARGSTPAPKGWESTGASDYIAPPRLTEAAAEREMRALRKAFPELTRQYDLEVGLVQDSMRKRGYRGQVPETVQAAVLQLKTKRSLIVLAAKAYRDRAKGAALLTHEVAHTFWNSLPEETRTQLRELRAEEIAKKTGPLYENGKLRTELDFLEENSERGVQEWFAERVARLNEEWALGRIDRTEHSMLLRLAYQVREFVRNVWEKMATRDGIDPDSELFVREFRRFFAGGADAEMGRAAGATYAERRGAQFAMGKDEAKRVVDEAAHVVPEIDRKTALQAELKRGRQLAAEGNRTGNDDALREGTRLTKLTRERLDEEFPGWEKPAQESTKGAMPAEGESTRPGSADGGEVPPDLREPSPFPAGDEPPPMRGGRFSEIYGQDSYEPTALAKTWAKAREVLTGIKGAVPELPTFPAAKWNQTDAFIRKHGATFYNRVKEGVRALKSGNDYVQRTAQDDVAKVVRPLIEAGAKFSADDYAALQKAQERARRMKAENKPVPSSLRAKITALNSQMEASPYVLFNRLVLALDFNWRLENLKDSEGNPIKLPAGVNESEVKAELKRLGNAIEANPHAALIKTAVREHMALVQRVADDLKGRELLEADHMANPFYFPHVTLETTRGGKTEQRELRPERVRPGTEADFRGYLIDPVGSAKAISTDYVRSMYYHLVQVGAHNFKADVNRDFFRPYDIKAEVEKRAKALSKERGVPVSWEQAFHEEFAPEGYTLYGTDSRDAFPSIEINRDALAQRLGVMLDGSDLQKQLHELGLKGVTLLPEDLRETMQMGAKETWIVPARVAEALRGVADRLNRQDHALDAAAKWTLGKWKAWKLFMPWNHVRYEYGNVVADTEKLLSADPRTFKYLAPAATELRDFWRGGTPSDDLRAALKEGVINAITAQEMGGLTRIKAFEAFQTRAQKAWNMFKQRGSSAAYQPVTSALGLGDFSSPELSALREAVTRYAKFKADLEAIRNGARPHYAGAYWRDVEAITDSRPGANDAAVRKAGAISKATFGDYGDLTVLGETLRDKFIPFYSWTEVNFKYHANLLRNLRDMVRAGETSQADAAKAGARAAAVFGAGFTARVAGGVMLRLALPYMAVYLWNNTGDREDLEKLLSEEDRRRFHVVLGRNADGKVSVVYGQTALMDVLRWFSGAKFVQSMAGWMNGRTDFPTAFSNWRDEVVPDFINNTVGSAGPYLKVPYTLASKKNPFPDVLDQRTVPAYDMRRVILGQITDDFTADLIERAVNKDYYAGKDVGAWAKQLVLQARQRDPEAWAFYEMKDKAAAYLERATGQHRDSAFDSPDQQVVRNFRRAIFKGDVEAATRFYLRLLDYGYTSERLAASIRAQDPLGSLPKALRQPFVQSLTEFDREQLQRAEQYYAKLRGARGYERQLFPSARWGQPWMQQYQQHPHTGELQRVMGQ